MKTKIVLVMLGGVVAWLAYTRLSSRHPVQQQQPPPPPSIRAAMHGIIQQVQACYEHDANVPAELAITATLDVSRDADLGTRVDAAVHTDDGSPLSHEFASCMRATLETLALPAPEHAFHVTYPFEFRRAGM
ncbi:MAG TPA: hypothetical protein VGG74_34305 [Kofleriaceae bacterium]|jgi:hypothetical protein